MKSKIFLSAFLLCLSACLGKMEEPSQMLKNAHTIHLEAVMIQEQVEVRLDSLKKMPAFKIKADSLAEILKEWETALLEVQGFEHKHKHSEHHHHTHNSPNLNDQQMLEYQQNTKKAIEELGRAIETLKSKK